MFPTTIQNGWRRAYPYVLLALFALPALWPLTHPGLPRTNDNLPHFYRVVELDQLVRAGVLFPRWAPDLVHGYGYPVFNYFPYLAHGLVEVFHLVGLNFLSAFKAAYVVALLGAAWGAYRLGRELFGERAGLAAGVAYLYSPYLLYDAHIRGSLPESLALGILPFAMLFLRRAAQGDRRAAVWAGAAIASVLLAHNGVALQAMPFLLGWAVWTEMAKGTRSPWNLGVGSWALLFVISPFAIAFLLSAFFWLPALAEAQYAQIERGTLNSAMGYANNFLSPGELLTLPRLPVDPALLNPPVVRSLPLAPLTLATLALVGRLLRSRSPHPHREASAWETPTLIFLLLATLIATLLILPSARLVWDVAPLLRLTLFPWRLLGPISLFVALMAGVSFAGPTQGGPTHRSAPTVFAICWLIIAGLPFASPPFEPAPATPTLADVAAFELPPDFVGTTTVGEYLPVWVKQLPDTTPHRDRLMRGVPIERFTAPGAEVRLTETRTVGHTFAINAPQPTTFIYRTFYFPGWRAMLDGQPAVIQITSPEGLMSVVAPAGSHTLTFHFGLTPPRAVGSGLSLLGLLIAFAFLSPLRSGVRNCPVRYASRVFEELGFSSPLPPHLQTLPPASRVWLLGVGILIALARPLVYDAGLTPLLQRRLGPEGLTGVAHPLNHDVSGELTLLGWDATRETAGADDSFTVNLYWKADKPLGVAYGIDLRLVDDAGLTWSEPDPPRPRDWRFTPGTDFWPPDQYILDPYVLTPLAGTPPGSYALQVTVFARHNLQTIGMIQIGSVTLSAPSRSRTCLAQGAVPSLPFGTFTLESAPISAAQLQSAAFSAAQAAPGDDVIVSLCWGAATAQDLIPRTHLELIGADGQARLNQRFVIGLAYPVARWQVGDVVRDQFKVRLPATIQTGRYDWVLNMDDLSVILGSLDITAPNRVFTAPEATHPLKADLGPVTLFGVDFPTRISPGAELPVTLVWESQELISESYHVFVHLLSADGAIAAQSDGVPADWTRPTTGWLPGEFVGETRRLTLRPDLAPGTYTLWAGMYLPLTGDRLGAPGFPEGRIRLGEVEIKPI